MKKLLSLLLSIVLLLTVMPMGAVTVSAENAVGEIVLTVDSLGLESSAYSAGTNTVDGVAFEWVQLGNYGNGIQARDKDGKTSSFCNTTAFSAPIKEIKLVFNSAKSTYDNADAEIFSFGTEAGTYTYSTKLSTTAGVKEYTITPDAETYTYLKFEHDLGYTMYWDSITIVLGKECEHTGDTKTVEENRVESTCTTNGFYDSVTYCAGCNKELSREKVVIDLNPNFHTNNEHTDFNCDECGKSFEISVEKAIEIGLAKEHNTYTNEKYYVTGKVIDVYETRYGNMYIADNSGGNKFTVYGSYGIDGTTRYDALAEKPIAGDTVTIYGAIGQYNGVAQIKNGLIVNIDFCKHQNTHTVNENVTEITCITDGNYDSVVYCNDCGREVSRTSIVKEAMGHNFTDVIPATEATCMKDGNVEYKACTVCNNNYSALADELSESALSDVTISKTSHALNSEGICTMCGNSRFVDYLTYEIANGAVTITGCNKDFAGEMIIPKTIDGYTVKIIGKKAFESCAYITSLIIPEGVIVIDSEAFLFCEKLKSITIPSTVTLIGANAFYNSYILSQYYSHTKIEDVYISDINAWLNVKFTQYSSNPMYNGANLYLNGELLTDITIPSNFKKVNDYVFNGCQSLASVTIPNSITSIGASSFYGCTALKNVIIPDSATSIGTSAFEKCTSLESIVIPDSITSLSGRMFRNCTGLKSVVIPDQVNEEVFYGCTALESVTINAQYRYGAAGEAFYYGYSDRDSFYGCNNIKSVYINSLDAWLNIGFYGSAANPLYYGADLYINGEKLINLVIPENYKSVRDYLFNGCTSLESVTIHNSVTSINYYAFYNCKNILQINYYGTQDEWNNITKEDYNYPLYLATINLLQCEEHIYDGTSDKLCNVCAKKREYVPGDLGGNYEGGTDGVINNKDLGVLMQYLNGWSYTNIVLEAADVNGDGAVNNRDYGLLLRYINGWDVELQ